LLALNTTAPTVAKLTSERVLAMIGRGCSAEVGSPPFGGVYGYCPASLPGFDEGGRVFGAGVADHAGAVIYVHRYPLLDSFAVVAPSNTDEVAGIIAVLIVLLGILMLVAERGGPRAGPGTADGASDDSSDAVETTVGGDGGD
jgi:hypothetical protein